MVASQKDVNISNEIWDGTGLTMILSVTSSARPREPGGSTLLAEALASTNIAGKPSEYFDIHDYKPSQCQLVPMIPNLRLFTRSG
jgi:hypothetical protein